VRSVHLYFPITLNVSNVNQKVYREVSVAVVFRSCSVGTPAILIEVFRIFFSFSRQILG
jgi:hypothetical protein